METVKKSLQDIFTAAWHHFILGGAPPAIGADGICSYLSENGNKCAVGLVLPEGHPSQHNGGSFSGLVKHYPELWDNHIKDLFEISQSSLTDFQSRLHDDHVGFGGWNKSLEDRKAAYLDVAKQFGLEVPAS